MARSLAGMDQLKSRWLRLAAGRATMFQSFTWNRLAAEALRETPYVVYARVEEQEAIIPAALVKSIDGTGDKLSFIGGSLFDYRGTLSSGELALAAARERLGELGLPLSPVPMRSESVAAWSGLTCTPFVGAPMVSLADFAVAANAPEAFAAAHPRLGRQLRRLARLGVQHSRRPGREVGGLIRRIFESKAAQFDHSVHNIFQDAACVDFMAAICAAPESACEVFALESGTQVIAALVTFRDRTTRRFYATYFDPAWEKHSPGQALLFEATRVSLAEGLDCDYMTGEQSYKMRLATRVEPLVMLSGTSKQSSGESNGELCLPAERPLKESVRVA